VAQMSHELTDATGSWACWLDDWIRSLSLRKPSFLQMGWTNYGYENHLRFVGWSFITYMWRCPKMRLPPYQVSKTHGDFGTHHRLTHREVQAALRRPDSHRRPGHGIWGHFGIPWYTKLIKVCMVLIDIPIIKYLHLDTYMVYHGIYNVFQMIYHDTKPYKCRY
jgi:hypothetical protein